IMDLLSETHRTAWYSSANEDWGRMSHFSRSDRLDRFFDSTSCTNCVELPDSIDGFTAAVATGRLKTGKLDDGDVTKRLQRWLGETASGGKPFFAVQVFQSTHFPYQQGHAIPDIFTPSEIPLLAFVSFVSTPPKYAK